MNILFATTLVPSGRGSGGEVVSGAVIDALEELGNRVLVAGFLRPGDEPQSGRETILVDRRPIETAQSRLRAAGWLARSFATGTPYTSAKFYSARYGREVRALLARQRIDAVVIDHTQVLWLLRWLPPHLRVLVLMHNAESELYARGARRPRSAIAQFIYRREAAELRKVEARMAARAERIWALSEADAASIRRLGGSAAVSVLPVMPDWGSEPLPRREPFFDVGLIATWSWHPNAEGLRWFLEHVHPRLPRGTTVHIAGNGAERVAGRHPGVVCHGFVDDAMAFLRSARVVAVPTRYGSGVETKMLASIAAGRAIVATSASVRGLADLPRTITIADNADAFAVAVAGKLRAAAGQADATASAAWCAARRRDFIALVGRDLSSTGSAAATTSIVDGARGFAEHAHAAI